WSLKDRKRHESFQAVVHDIPQSLTTETIWVDNHMHELFTSLHAFKIVREGNMRKLIGFLKTWSDLKNLVGSGFVWDRKEFRWCSHTPPSFKKLNNQPKKQKKNPGSSSKTRQTNEKNSEIPSGSKKNETKSHTKKQKTKKSSKKKKVSG